MPKIIISLDKNILNKHSRAAERMAHYGQTDDLFIIVPDKTKQHISVSDSVEVWGTGGSKIQQFLNIVKIGREIAKKNKIDSITSQDPFFTGLAGYFLKKKTNLKFEVQLHGDFYGSDYYKKSGLKNLVQYYLGKMFVLKNADAIRVVGERIKQSLLKFGIPDNKIILRPIAVEVDMIKKYEVKTDLHKKYPQYSKIFLSMGRLEKVKNIPFLVDVFADVVKTKKDYLLLIVGKGEQKNILEKKVKDLNLERNVKFEEWSNDPISYVKTSDCILFPSLSEGYGLVAMEAFAAGKYVIMNDVGVANFELKPSEKVIILPINNKEEYINAIVKKIL